MDHTEALDTHATERYLLGELSAAETDAFEEHYFDCLTCAEDVRLGTSFMEAGKRLVREPAAEAAPAAKAAAPVVPIESHPRWQKWIPAAAVAAVLSIPVHFALLMRMQNAAPVAVATGASGPTLLPMNSATRVLEISTRGADADGGPTVVTYESPLINIPTATRFESYLVEVRDASGNAVFRSHPSREDAESPTVIDSSRFKPGLHRVVISGIKSDGQTEVIGTAEFTKEVAKREGSNHNEVRRRERWSSLTTQVPALQAA